MLLIISAHVALLAFVMSARMEFSPAKHDRTVVDFIPAPPPPPPPNGTTSKRTADTNDQQITHTRTTTDLPPMGGQTAATDDQTNGGEVALGGDGFPQLPPPPPLPVRHEARLLTPPSELKPPYPESKILSEEETTLQLRLTVSERGRVIAVDPIGAADRVFLDAARRYLIAHWRYQPATDDGRAIASSVIISLHFQLDG